MAKATFAAGCFWAPEVKFRAVTGVIDAPVGYTGGTTLNPGYRDICTGQTGHAEAVEVEYAPDVVSYEGLLEAFWIMHDPTTHNRQGPDIGSQYRSAIFFHDADQEAQARASLERLDASGAFRDPIVTEIVAAGPFYRAEEDHQRFFEKRGMLHHVGAH
jgi:peptide-methionine (S)-S-oxide reductase